MTRTAMPIPARALATLAALLGAAALVTVPAPRAEASICPTYVVDQASWGWGAVCAYEGSSTYDLQIRTDDTLTDGRCVFAARYNNASGRWDEISGTRSCGPRVSVRVSMSGFTDYYSYGVRVYRSDRSNYFTVCDGRLNRVPNTPTCYY